MSKYESEELMVAANMPAIASPASAAGSSRTGKIDEHVFRFGCGCQRRGEQSTAHYAYHYCRRKLKSLPKPIATRRARLSSSSLRMAMKRSNTCGIPK